MSGEIKVDTKLFISTTEVIDPERRLIEGAHREWQDKLAALRKVWQGDASDNVKATAGQIAKSTANILEALAGYSKALNEMAGIFSKAESELQEKGKSLSFGKSIR